MAIMTYEQFHELTYDRFNYRGTELAAIDEALKAYQKKNTREGVRKIQVAFNKWTTKQGPNWPQHARNAKGAFNKLNAQLSDFLSDRAVDMAAQRRVHESRRGALKRVLGDRKLVVKRTTQLDTLHNVESAALDTKRAVTALGAAPARTTVTHGAAESVVHGLLKNLFSTDIIAEIQGELVQGFVREMVTSVTPFLSHVKSGVEAIGYCGMAIRDSYRMAVVKELSAGVLPGNPAEAVEAIHELLERAQNQHITSAMISGTEFAARCGATVLDGGTASGAVIGAAKAMAKLIQNVYVVGRDYVEKQKANALLASDEVLTSKLFRVNPLLGAYFISFGEPHDLVNLCGTEVGTHGWEEFVEFGNRTHLKPLKERANSLIFASRFEVEGLTVRGTGIVDGTKQRLMDTVGIRS